MNHDRKMSPVSFKSDQKSIPEGSNIDHNSENCPMRDPTRGPSGTRKMGPRGVPKSIKNLSPRGPKSTINRSKRDPERLSVKNRFLDAQKSALWQFLAVRNSISKILRRLWPPKKGPKIDAKSIKNQSKTRHTKKMPKSCKKGRYCTPGTSKNMKKLVCFHHFGHFYKKHVKITKNQFFDKNVAPEGTQNRVKK